MSRKAMILLRSSRDLMNAEDILINEDIKSKCVPIPEKFSKDCGAALEIKGEVSAEAIKALLDHGMEPRLEYLSNLNNHSSLPLPENGGCSAKLGPDELDGLLSSDVIPDHPSLFISPSGHDDGSVVETPSGELLIQTVDFFTPIVENPYDFGQIAAANALSDVYAMGGKPLSGMVLAGFAKSKLPLELLSLILTGGADKLTESGAAMAGGHTIDVNPPIYGLAVTGIVKKDHIFSNAAVQPGDKFILTKPLGTALVLSGYRVKVYEDDTSYLNHAVESMKKLNRGAATAFRKGGVKAATDVTGFGLAGHALKMARASGVSIRLKGSDLPGLPGSRELAGMGCIPGAALRNLDFVKPHTFFAPSLKAVDKWLTVDPQTSGGILAAVSPDRVEMVINELKIRGECFEVIGEAVKAETSTLEIY